MIAFVDESYKRFGNTALQHYALAAVIVSVSEQSAIRETLNGLLLRGQRELHWRDERTERRRQLVDALAESRFEILYVCRVCPKGEKQERSRALCMERLLIAATLAGVTRVVADSRQSRLDQKDLHVLAGLRSKRWLAGDLLLAHRSGRDEDLLWAADLVCGALADDLDGMAHYKRFKFSVSVAIELLSA